MESTIKNKDLHDILVQLASLQSEVLSASTKNLVYKIWKEIQKHEGDYKRALSTVPKQKLVDPLNGIWLDLTENDTREGKELANQEINITFQPVDWNSILKTSDGKDRDLIYAYEFDQISIFFTNYK